MTRSLGLVFAVLALALAGCASDPGTTANAAEKKAAPKFDEAAYVAKVEKAASESSGSAKIKDGCHLPEITWQCLYDRVEAPFKGRLDVHLSTPGDVSKAEAKEASERARLWWFNMAGTTIKDLDTIVTFVNDRDTGTTQRADVPLLNR